MTTRRNFIKGLSLFSAFAAGMTTPTESLAKSEFKSLSDKRLMDMKPEEDDIYGLITLSKNNRTLENSVMMTVGKDNRLWIKVDQEWKRLSVDN